MHTLILIAGLPGVGKSTLSRKIAQRFQAQFIDIDDFKKETADPLLVRSEIDPPDIRRIYYKKAVEAAFSVFQMGTSIVVMEEIFHLALLRGEITSMCCETGVRILWIEMTCPYEIVRDRLSANGRIGHILTTEDALKMYIMFKEVFESFPFGNGNIHIDNSESISINAGLVKVERYFENSFC